VVSYRTSVLTGPGDPNVVAAAGARAGEAIRDVLAVARPVNGEFAVDRPFAGELAAVRPVSGESAAARPFAGEFAGAGRGRDGILGCPAGGLGGAGSCGRAREWWWWGCFGGRRGAAEAGEEAGRRPATIAAMARASTGALLMAVRGYGRGNLTCGDLIWRSAYL
jgi:hypothetical protein